MKHLKLQSSQRIVDDQGRIVLGEGRVQLLALIDQTGSINQAAKQMKMSYKSAWSKIKSTEDHLGEPVIHSDKRTGSRLTRLGRRLLGQYRQLKRDCIAADDRIFSTIFNLPGPRHTTVIAIAGYSGSGKTTLIEKIIPKLTAMGLRVGTVKHHHGEEGLDTPGKDTWRHQQAGASATILAAPGQIQLVMDHPDAADPDDLAARLPPMDLVLVEGFKHSALPKIEIYRPDATGATAPLGVTDSQVVAIVTNATTKLPSIPRFGLTDLDALAEFIAARHRQQTAA